MHHHLEQAVANWARSCPGYGPATIHADRVEVGPLAAIRRADGYWIRGPIGETKLSRASEAAGWLVGCLNYAAREHAMALLVARFPALAAKARGCHTVMELRALWLEGLGAVKAVAA